MVGTIGTRSNLIKSPRVFAEDPAFSLSVSRARWSARISVESGEIARDFLSGAMMGAIYWLRIFVST
jgi:hypothetical protein